MSIFAGMIAVAGALCAAEEKYVQPYAAQQLAQYLPEKTALSLPPAYAAVLVVNLVGATMTLIALGMRVGKARKAFKIEVRRRGAVKQRKTIGTVPGKVLPAAARRPPRRSGARCGGIARDAPTATLPACCAERALASRSTPRCTRPAPARTP